MPRRRWRGRRRHIYLAGRPGELEAALKAAGVQDFIYVGCDVLATLAGSASAILGRRAMSQRVAPIIQP